MEAIISHKIRLKPTKVQAEYFSKAAGTARFAYNWALDKWNEQSKNGDKPNQGDLRKDLNSIKRDEFPWMMEVTKCAPQQAIKNLGVAFNNAFDRARKNQPVCLIKRDKKLGKWREPTYKEKFGFPTFHKKGKNDSFYLDNVSFKVDGRYIKIPLLSDGIKMTEDLRFDGKLMSATISRTACYWFVSISVKVDNFDHLKPTENQGVVGVDLGIKDLAVLSNGEKFTGPKPYKYLFNRLRRLQKSLSRKKIGSNNRQKVKNKLAKLHYIIACIRGDFTHKLTSYLTSNFNTIVIEDLNVKGMLKNHKLAKLISDMAWGEFKRQLEYKSKMRGNELIVADIFFASSKLCSNCGWRHKQLKLSDRKWTCQNCNTIHDRDINAALNLKQLAVRSTVSACGDFLVPNSSTKQEIHSSNVNTC